MLQVKVHQLVECLEKRQAGPFTCNQHFPGLSIPVVQHRLEQTLLAAEVLDQRRGGCADPLGDRSDRATAIAELGKDDRGALDDLLTAADPSPIGTA